MFDFDTITIRHVSRNYGRRRALVRVSASCRAGDVLALLGPNGAGKSTLLGVLSTALAPTSGTILFGNTAAGDLGAALRRRIGVLGHDLFLYPELTARENLTFFAQLHGVGDYVRQVDEALGRARLQERADEPVVGFSRGMRQRLALERALMHRPRLLLLDEPFTGLDDRSAVALSERLRELGTAGTIIILATHDLEVIDRVANRAWLLQDGRLGDVPPGGTLRERYRAATAIRETA